MSIQVGGVTVIDNSRNLINVNISGGWSLLNSYTISAGNTSTVAFDLASYGLGSTSCSYIKYKAVLENLYVSTSGSILIMSTQDSSGVGISTGNYYKDTNAGSTGANNAMEMTLYCNASNKAVTIETEFSTPGGYTFSTGAKTRFYSYGPNEIPVYYTVGKQPARYYYWINTGSFQGGTMKLYGFGR